MAHLRVLAQMGVEYGRLALAGRGADRAERVVQAAYRAFLRREPSAAELAALAAEMRSGGLRAGGLISRMVHSNEFRRRFAGPESAAPPLPAPPDQAGLQEIYERVVASAGPEASHEQFLQAAYRTILGREPDAAGSEQFLRMLRAGSMTRRDGVAFMLSSAEYLGRKGVSELPSADQMYQRVLAELEEGADDGRFLQVAYRLIFKREPDVIGHDHFMRSLERGTMTRADMVASMMASSEYLIVAGLPVHPLHALHQARMMLFQQHLPAARRVIDLGGAAHNHAEGALLLMGYPHRPEEILILDLPPDYRIGGADAAEGQQEIVTGDGIRVRYLYRSMADLADIPDASADLIVSGESIEHISEADAEIVCREAFRILQPGGSFCLDTPNAALTRLQMPDEFIHPEHQKEYLVWELRDMLNKNGFLIAEEKGVCPMPMSLQSGQFDIGEISRNISLSDTAEEGYVFYIRAVKPQPGAESA